VHLLTTEKCHSEPFASCHSEGEKRLKNLAQDKLREESKRDSSPTGLRMTNRVAKQPQECEWGNAKQFLLIACCTTLVKCILVKIQINAILDLRGVNVGPIIDC